MYLLDKDISGRPCGQPSGFIVALSSNWSIDDLPNGGYLMALLGNSILSVSAKKRLALMTATFVARSVPGEAFVATEKIALSSQFERWETPRLIQNGAEKIRAFGTLVDDDLACTIDRYEAGAPAVAPLSQCVAIPRMPQISLYDQVEVRLDPACAGWMENRHSDRSEFRGWFRFRDQRPWDAIGLLVAADAFPPPVYASQGLAAWVPTIEMSVNIRRLPAAQWLKCIFRTRFISCGLLEEDGELWDEKGELTALSRQIAHYRPLA